MKLTKKLFSILIFVMAFTLVACGSSMSTTFPNIKSNDIPDILEKRVGTLGDTYFTSFNSSDNKDYQSFFKATFKNTTETDYNELIKHYQSTSSGSDDNGSLFFDWGRLEVISSNNSIRIEAYIKF